MYSQCLYVTLFLLCVTSSISSDCKPGKNCEFPGCRCWDDPDSPGNINRGSTPQMVLVSFADDYDRDLLFEYSHLLDEAANPNGCQASGTFFENQWQFDEFDLRRIHSAGFEMGVTFDNAIVPTPHMEWGKGLQMRKEFLEKKVGIPSDEVVGVRAPNWIFGGDKELEGMAQNGFTYDSSCITEEYTTKESLLWPYTYDFVDSTPKCKYGFSPSKSHPGKWQFIRPEFEYNSTVKCQTVTQCMPYLEDSTDTLRFLQRNFDKHYNGNRTPFILDLTNYWLRKHYSDTSGFLMQLVIPNPKDDVWVISHSQALQWMKNPVSVDESKTFPPWSCVAAQENQSRRIQSQSKMGVSTFRLVFLD